MMNKISCDLSEDFDPVQITRQSFQQESYNRHGEWYNQHFPTAENKVDYYKRMKSARTNNISGWLQQRFFSCLDPLLKISGQTWLTVGDAYGFDAQYILAAKGQKAVASDLNSDLLKVAKREGIINDYCSENAEHLSFMDNRFDYVLCKESYHHFPRPYAALYEMIRVSKKGMVIIEPQDPVSKMPLLLFLTNFLSLFKSNLVSKVWKNRFSYEPVGNFIYKVAEREFEKFAAGLNLPLVAFKPINPNFYFKGAEHAAAHPKNSRFIAIIIKKALLDLFVKFKLIPGQVLCTVIFKEIPAPDTLQQLKNSGYHLVAIPPNPYLKADV